MEITNVEIAVRLVLALLLGGLVGIERKATGGQLDFEHTF